MHVAHIGHAELDVTDLEASTRFFTELLGLYVSEQDADRVYLRAWQDIDHHTLVLKEAPRSGMSHMGWRVHTADEVIDIERRLDKLGIETRWVEGGDERGHGDALRFESPAGLPFELYWDVERYTAPAAEASALPSHPQKVPARGAGPRRFDHVNFTVEDVAHEQDWLSRELGIHHRYYANGPDGGRWGSWLSRTCISHEIAIRKSVGTTGSQLHHIAFYMDSGEDVLRSATLLADHGTPIEWGPGKHAASDATFLYFREPSGNRVELWTGGMLIFDPDWEPQEWSPEIMMLGMDLWGSSMPESFVREGTALGTTAPSAA